MNTIKSIVSGSVVKIHVEPGARVAAGDVIVTVESMKMEIPVEAEEGGVIGNVLVAVGQPVNEDDDVATLA